MDIVFETVARGYYLEALLVDGSDVWFSDVVEGGINRLSHGAAAGRFLADRRLVGGLGCNADGKILVSGEGGIVWFDPADGSSGVLIDSFTGRALAGVNEMRADGQGGLYFGTVDLPAIKRGEQPGPTGLYHLSPDLRVRQLAGELVFTNGMCPDGDGRTLFHNESFVGTFAYPIGCDGSLGARRMVREKADCDGIALDADGNLWLCGFSSGSLLVVRPDGSVIDCVPLPGKACTNVRFGGDDMREIYVTIVTPEAALALKNGAMPQKQDSVLYKGRSPVAGAAMAKTEFALA